MTVNIQIVSECLNLPNEEALTQWVQLAIKQRHKAEVVVRIVDDAESAELNETYRQKKGPTNVLSFPFEAPEGLPMEALTEDVLGDLVICAPVVLREASEQRKPVLSHWAHMVVHGCLHLQGYDHINAKDADVMESLEIELLNNIGIKNPYEG
ncbi:MAG TPA: rRNA maturation RNase YbeY [Cycloclasticus sp.]|jgi:probable rRNA maturation factor|nr:rRNA maturation RNase YbeY [Cycloclasticus sp.]HIL91279.1 rRNA maturation RNase YbeY [Cycloclasticus sp.]